MTASFPISAATIGCDSSERSKARTDYIVGPGPLRSLRPIHTRDIMWLAISTCRDLLPRFVKSFGTFGARSLSLIGSLFQDFAESLGVQCVLIREDNYRNRSCLSVAHVVNIATEPTSVRQ